MKKRYYILGGLLLLVFLVLFFLSTITRNYLVKHSEELIGRKLAMSELHFDYWNVAVDAENVVLYEKNAVDSFISFKSLQIDFSPWKLLHKEYSFSKISLIDPLVNVEQYQNGYNFSDLIPEEDTVKVANDENTAIVKFSLYNISLSGGQVRLYDQTVDNRVKITNMDFHLPLIAWDNKKSNVGADFTIGDQGKVTVNAIVDNEAKNYEVDLTTSDLQINPVSNYLTDYFDVSSINGLLNSTIQIQGSLNDLMNVQITGFARLHNASVVDSQGETLLTVPEIRTRMKNIDMKHFAFDFSSIEIDEPSLMVTRGKEETNVEQFFAPLLEEDTTQVVQVTMQKGDQVTTTYDIDTLKVNRGELRFADRTLHRPCLIRLSDMNVELQNLSDSSTYMPITFSTNINQSGQLSGKTVVNMQDPFDLYLDGKLKDVDLVSFSPYSEYYIASPFTQGWFNYAITVKMGNGKLKNDNDIHIKELEFGKKTSDKPYMKVPIRLGLYVMKDAHDNININMPVSGSTSDPKFKLGKLIWGAFLNVLSKAALSPFKAMSGLVGADPEKLELIRLDYLQDSLKADQINTLNSLTKIMKKKPDLLVSFIQRTNLQEETDLLRAKLVKEDYVAATGATALPDDKDGAFVQYLSTKVAGADTLALPDVYRKLVDRTRVRTEFKNLLDERNQMILTYLEGQGIPAESIKVSTADLLNLPDELRTPEFKVEVELK